jgi:hypothetical protein
LFIKVAIQIKLRCKKMLASSVADLESGAFLTPGSGMGKISGSGMNNPDHISESFKKHFLGLK